MTIQDAHVKQARLLFQPCVEDFEADFTGIKIDMSYISDSEIIKAYRFIADYESCLAND